jgi:hypothetical protein
MADRDTVGGRLQLHRPFAEGGQPSPDQTIIDTGGVCTQHEAVHIPASRALADAEADNRQPCRRCAHFHDPGQRASLLPLVVNRSNQDELGVLCVLCVLCAFVQILVSYLSGTWVY